MDNIIIIFSITHESLTVCPRYHINIFVKRLANELTLLTYIDIYNDIIMMDLSEWLKTFLRYCCESDIFRLKTFLRHCCESEGCRYPLTIISNEEICLQHSLEMLKHSLQNFRKIWNKSFPSATCTLSYMHIELHAHWATCTVIYMHSDIHAHWSS